ncbi:MAG TPA: serine/threonine-protein kinase [Gemmatimonadales bacterium]
MSEIPDPLRAALGERYDLQRVLGRGGMASVYLAADRKHHRPVAIKILRPDLAASIGAERFLIEIEIAARLTHPHILALHDSGESAGFLYYVMPYIDGGSLRTRIETSRRLDPSAVNGIALSVAGALSYAHRMGVVHRDIKPENILFAQGLPIVADFGIAKAISTAGGEQLTRTGFPLGTPGYMSPEQAAGLTDLDVRTDVYSLAVVCYEMLVGSVPGRWPTEDAVRAGRFIDAPAAHRAILDTLPAAAEPALVHAMAIRHDQRTATADDLIAELTASGARAAQAAPDTQPVRRRYSDGEVGEIIKRASEMEVSQPTLSGSLTIGGIQQVAGEAGIDPAMVRAAAGEFGRGRGPTTSEQKPRTFGAFVAGGPMRVTLERVVQGELTESDCAYLVDEVRAVTGHSGMVGTLGKSVNWTAARREAGSGMGRDLQLSISMRGGMTRIGIRENMGPLAGAIFGGMGGGLGGGGMGPIMGIFAGGLHAPLLAAIIAPLWVVSVLSGARTLFHYKSNGRKKELEALIDRLAAMAQGLVAEGGALPSSSSAGRLGPG